MPAFLDPVFGYLIVVGIALLLASAAGHKLRGLGRFTGIFIAYGVLPAPLGRRVAWLVPCVELGIAIDLVWRPNRPPAALAAMGILTVYAMGLGINLVRGRHDLDCGCGIARDSHPIAPWMVWRNLFLVAALAIAALPWSSRALDAADFLTVAAGLVVCAALYAALDRLLGEVAPRSAALRRTS